MPKLTERRRCLILADYLEGKMRVEDIAARHGVARTYPSTLATRTGVQMRNLSLRVRMKEQLVTKLSRRDARDWLVVSSPGRTFTSPLIRAMLRRQQEKAQ